MMKLSNIAEGSFGNLASAAASKVGSNPEDRLTVRSNAQLFNMVKAAKQFTYHLFDRRALPWWREVLKYFKIPSNKHKDVLTAARSEYYDRIDRDLFEADISKIVDLLNPRTRRGTTKGMARSAANEKLAIAIIGHISRASESIGVGQEMAKATTPAKDLVRAKALTPRQKKSKLQGKIKQPPPASGKEHVMAKMVAKRALRSQGLDKIQHLEKLDSMGYRIDYNKTPPKLRRKTKTEGVLNTFWWI